MSNSAAIRQSVTGKMEGALEHLKRDLAAGCERDGHRWRCLTMCVWIITAR